MADIFDAYALADAWDEMFERPGEVRTAYEPVLAALQPIEPSELQVPGGPDGPGVHGPRRDLRLRGRGAALAAGPRAPDPRRPRMGSHTTRGEPESQSPGGLPRRRLRALPCLRGRCRALAAAAQLPALPPRRPTGVEPPGGVRIHVAGIDLVRDEAGDFRVLEDNVRVPSGVSYVIENRRAMTRIFPSLFAEQHVLPVDGYCHRLLAALRAAAPDGVPGPAGRRPDPRARATPPTSNTPCSPG